MTTDHRLLAVVLLLVIVAICITTGILVSEWLRTTAYNACVQTSYPEYCLKNLP